jgi:hypothetical protein
MEATDETPLSRGRGHRPRRRRQRQLLAARRKRAGDPSLLHYGAPTHSPSYDPFGPPAGATAQCADGTYSFSQHRSGTCSHHGGVQ